MDPIIYFFAEYFPWWSIPSAVILAEISNHFRRTGQRFRFMASAGICFIMVILTIVYFTHSGFLNLRPAMKEIEWAYEKK